MRILLVLDRVENPASANALMGFRLAEQLLRRDHTVHILTLWDGLHTPPAPPEGAMQHLLAFADELPLYLLLKNALRRQRPVGLPVFITPSDRYSLPSGHTAAAFLMATVLAASFPLWAPLLFLWAILVGASRLLLGVHYLSDLVAGALLGGGCAVLALGWSHS